MRITPIEYTEATRVLFRNWLRVLDPSAFAVAAFIFDKTYGWSKPNEVITYKQFAEGIACSQRTIQRALKSLVEQKVLQATPSGKAGCLTVRYQLNLEWNMLKLSKARAAQMQDAHNKVRPALAIPKPKKEVEGGIGQNDLGRKERKEKARVSPPQTPPLPKEKEKKESSLAEVPSSNRLGGSPQSKMDEIRSKSRSRFERAKEHGGMDSANSNHLEVLWGEACREHFDGVRLFPWQVKEKAQVMRVRKVFLSNGGSSAKFLALMQWSLKHWHQMTRIEFAWMKSPPPPPFPAIMFWVKWVDRFSQRMQRGFVVQAPLAAGEAAVPEGVLKKRRQQLLLLDKQIRERQTKLLQVTPEEVEARVSRFRRTPIVAEGVDASPTVKGLKGAVAVIRKLKFREDE